MRKIFLPLMAILLFVSCQKDTKTFSICHKTSSHANSWKTIEINANALQAHLAHGDVVPDGDGDGYTKVNPCGIGTQNDCDDDKAATNPRATEICNNGIDDNCNGEMDENCIASVTICNKVWMLKNLEVTKYRNGDDIPQVTNAAAWAGLTTGAWCYYDNNAANGATYGKLYNWYAVTDPRGLAPEGWHVPSDAEWTALIDCLGGDAVAGGKMKETGTTHWVSPNTGADNSSGFNGLPGGYRDFSFGGIGRFGYWWSSTASTTQATDAWSRFVNYSFANAVRSSAYKSSGFSVRCVRD